MDKYYDFSDCKRSRKQFGGSDRKESVFFEESRYMLKFPDRIAPDKRNELNSSYRNNVFSEYISCHIINELGYDAQETLLGTYKGKETVACKDFCTGGFELNEFEKYKSSFSVDFENTRYPDIFDVVKALSKDRDRVDIDPEISLTQFWDIFMQSDFAKSDARVLSSVDKLKERYDKKIIEKVVSETPGLSDIRCEFYIKMIDKRMGGLLL